MISSYLSTLTLPPNRVQCRRLTLFRNMVRPVVHILRHHVCRTFLVCDSTGHKSYKNNFISHDPTSSTLIYQLNYKAVIFRLVFMSLWQLLSIFRFHGKTPKTGLFFVQRSLHICPQHRVPHLQKRGSKKCRGQMCKNPCTIGEKSPERMHSFCTFCRNTKKSDKCARIFAHPPTHRESAPREETGAYKDGEE
jgi:hypothetical protein